MALLTPTTDQSASLSPISSTSPDVGAQRFFSQGKRIPKDVKRHCGMCKQHNVFVETRGHTCEFKNCNCEQCELVRKRREIMSTQIRLRREQDKKFQRTNNAQEADIVPYFGDVGEEKLDIEPNSMCYFCQKCKNHGVLMWKKDHKKKCQYTDCRCDQCDLIDSRRALDRHIKKRKNSGKDGSKSPKKSPKKEEPSSDDSSSSESSLSAPIVPEPQDVSKLMAFRCSDTTATTSPVPSPIQNPPPVNLFNIPPIFTPMIAPALMGATPFNFCTPNIFNNPFLTMSPLDMQLFFANIQCINEMTAAVSLANTQ